jgi:hypothetical protein
MLLIAAFVLAGALGWARAAKRGGTLPDRLQFALAHAIPATLAALLLQIIALRLGLLG